MSNWRDYVSIARPAHWVKHVFILPGIVLALALTGSAGDRLWSRVLLGLLSASLAASANYVLNEWLDRESDRHHPIKSKRPAASGRLSAPGVAVEYLVLTFAALWLAFLVSRRFLSITILFLCCAILYNVRPARTKDRAFLDVLTEAVNNPIRLLLGWTMVSANTVPPVSIVLAYWFGGAYLMAVKRLAEYRHIGKETGTEALAKYRQSFLLYREHSLLVSSFMYGVLSSFGLAVFLVKYRSEYVFAIPQFALLFAYYLHLGLKDQSVAQAPEQLYREKGLWMIVALLTGSVLFLSFVDLPLAEILVQGRIPYSRF